MVQGLSAVPRRLLSLSGAAALLAAVAMGAGACGPAASSAASRCDSPGVSRSEIRLGLIYPDTGPTATGLAAFRAGVDARIGLQNDQGGIHGRKVVYEWRDDKDDPTANSTAAKDLIEQHKVFGLLEFTLNADGSAQYLADHGIPVGGLAVGEAWTRNPNMFSYGTSATTGVDLFGGVLRQLGGTKAAVLSTDVSAGVSKSTSSYAQSLRAAGIPIVDQIGYTAGANSPAAVAQRINNSGADTLLLSINAGDLAPVMAAIRAGAPRVRVVQSLGGYDHQILRQTGGAMAGVVIALNFRPFEAGGPAIDTFRQAMSRHVPEVTDPDQQLAMMAYIDTDLYLRGLQIAGACPTRAGYISGLRAVTNYDAGGLIAPLNIARDLGKQSTCWSFVQVNPAGNAFNVLRDSQCGRLLPPDNGG